MKNFVIFKNGRTGSSNLALAINKNPSAFCYLEILNEYKHSDLSIVEYINQKLSKKNEFDIVGFSVNPFKKPKLALNFWDFSPDNENFIFLLTRDIFDQTISKYVSNLASSWPANKKSKNANEIISLVESGLTINVSLFEELLISNMRQSEEIEKFVTDFSERSDTPVENLEYEKLYGQNKSDLNKINNSLGLKLPEQDFNLKHKLLPVDLSTFIRNFEEIEKIRGKYK